jgi:DNA polymerase III subunit gamma/tau
MKSLATAPPNPVPPPEVPSPAPDPSPPPAPGVPDPVPLPTPVEPGLPTYEDVPPVKPIDGRAEPRGAFEALPRAA